MDECGASAGSVSGGTNSNGGSGSRGSSGGGRGGGGGRRGSADAGEMAVGSDDDSSGESADGAFASSTVYEESFIEASLQVLGVFVHVRIVNRVSVGV